MPNWCTGTLRVVGPQSLLDLLRLDLPLLSLDAVVPRPRVFDGIHYGGSPGEAERPVLWREVTVDGERIRVDIGDDEREALMSEFGATNWYDWSHENWGTKWDIEPTAWQEQDGALNAWLETASGPPVPVMLELSRRYPEARIEISYHVELIGDGFVACEGGAITEHEFSEYDWDAIFADRERELRGDG